MGTNEYGFESTQEDDTESSIHLLDKIPGKEWSETEVKGTNMKKVNKMVGVFEIFRYADKWDKLLMVFGIFFNMLFGLNIPFQLILWSKSSAYFIMFGKLRYFLSTIQEYLDAYNITTTQILMNPSMLESQCDDIINFYGGNITCTVSVEEGIFDKLSGFATLFSLLGLWMTATGYLGFSFLVMASERQANRIRRMLLYNALRQSIGWFDAHTAAVLNNRLSDDIVQIQDGMGDKVGSFFRTFSMAVASFFLGFYYGWKLALVVSSMCPLLVIASISVSKISSSMTTKELKECAKAGAIAEEVFGAIRTVVAFGGQEKEAMRYYKKLKAARSYGVKKGMIHGLTMGSIYFSVSVLQAVAFWYGGKLHRDDPGSYSPDTVIIVFSSLVSGAFHMGNSIPSLQDLTAARGAAFEVFTLIELKSSIDSCSEEGKKPSNSKGVIEFKNVHFAYPARPDVKVLNDVNFEVLPGQTVAFVGASGCGKSTTVQLLLRFYDSDEGQILLDGCDIKDLNIKWLRKNIGLVSQEPVLFATTIAENIRYGREDVTIDEIIAATKNANAYDFIMQLPDNFETFVGERGCQLSGGQKQRIAIARALVRDPKILLLDEATSSLDTESESIVQEALDKACRSRTTIVIAHRLSTIKNADVIIGYQDGHVLEKGTHDILMDHKGIYYQLVMNQMTLKDEDHDETDSNDKMGLDNRSNNRMSNHFLENENKTEIDEDDEEEDLPDAPFSRLLKMNSPEWYFIAGGCIGGIGTGCIFPLLGFLFSETMNVFSKDKETQEKEFFKCAMQLLVVGLFSFVSYFLQGYMFGQSGEALTLRLRDLTFRAMMKQDIEWFDDPKNGVGALTTRLTTDASQVQGVTGVRLGTLLMSVTCVCGSLIIAFVSGWQMTLLLLAFIPLIALGDIVNYKMAAEQSNKIKESFEEAGKITVESLGNIRTVASLSKEEKFFSLYMETIKTPYKTAMRNAHFRGIAFSFSQSAVLFFDACAFLFGAYMVEQGHMTTEDVLKVLFTVFFGAIGLGNASAFAPDFGKAQMAAKRILNILDSKPSKDYTNSGGTKLNNNYSATLSFHDVNFHYTLRNTVPVLQDLKLSVSPGQTLALVGSSGCGKSTTVQLIERFYDTVTGMVCIDNHDIRTLNIEWLRSQMALVSQEPVLFDQTIGDNIAFGDNSRDVPIEEIVEAARTANIHSFITSLPNGYDTNVGSKGAQLSGGQKQRIAIARAVVRNPRILLLDEATSSLDTESEKVVQEALDRARVGRTCITIAHRLATVKNADKICVIKNGTVTEEGTHRELMAIKGFYNKLIEKSMGTIK